MSKESTETTSTRLDPGMEQYRQFVHDTARGVASTPFEAYTGNRVAGMDPAELQGYQSMIEGNPQLRGALTGAMGGLGVFGQPVDIDQFMDPYLSEVVGSAQSDFDRMRATSLNEVGAGATAARAFGGSRHAIAEGTTLGEIARAEGSTLANLRSGGFQNAVQAALQARHQAGTFGLGAASLLNQSDMQRGMAGVQLGQTRRGIEQAGRDASFDEFMRRINFPRENLSLLQGTMASSPYGQTDTVTSRGSTFNTLLGLGTTAASFFPPTAAPMAAARAAGAVGGSGGLSMNPTPFNFGR